MPIQFSRQLIKMACSTLLKAALEFLSIKSTLFPLSAAKQRFNLEGGQSLCYVVL